MKTKLKIYKMATSILLKFLTLKWDISRIIWRIEVSDSSLFCIFHALSFELNFCFRPEVPFNQNLHCIQLVNTASLLKYYLGFHCTGTVIESIQLRILLFQFLVCFWLLLKDFSYFWLRFEWPLFHCLKTGFWRQRDKNFRYLCCYDRYDLCDWQIDLNLKIESFDKIYLWRSSVKRIKQGSFSCLSDKVTMKQTFQNFSCHWILAPDVNLWLSARKNLGGRKDNWQLFLKQ